MRKYKLADRWPKNERGEWVDASGDPITHERIMRHAESIKIQIIKHFPKGYCQNSREEFEALFNNGFEEILLSLLKFDKHECLNKVNANSKFKRSGDQERLDWKTKNPEEALQQGEHEWVMKALGNYYRRHRHDHSEAKRGGIETPMPMSDILSECYAREMDDGSDSSFGPRLGADVIPMRDVSSETQILGIPKQAFLDMEMLNEILETDGREAMLEHYNSHLTQERRENLEQLLRFQTSQDADQREAYLAQVYAQSNQEAQEEQQESTSEVIDDVVEDEA